MAAKLKRLALYRENTNDPKNPNLPSVGENLNVLDDDQKKMVVDYMKLAATRLVFLTDQRDPYFHDEMLEDIVYSDGTFMWDSITLNWVENHGVRLPDVFLDHVKSFDGNANRLVELGENVTVEDMKVSERILVE